MSTLFVDNLQPNLGSRVMAAGHVVQVVSAPLLRLDTATPEFSDLGGATITPTSANSQILIAFENHIYVRYLQSLWKGGLVRLNRGSTTIYGDAAGEYGESNLSSSASDRFMTYSHRHYIDQPNTTSAIAYTVQGASRDSQVNITFNNLSYGSQGRITLMEIAQ